MSHRWLSGVGVAAAAIVLGATSSIEGVLTGGSLLVLWYVLPVVATFAIGHLVVIVLFSSNVSLVALVLFEMGLVGMLVGETYRRTRSKSAAAVLAGSFSLFLGLLWLTSDGGSVLEATILVGAIGMLLYATHRYERVTMNLVTE